jgi:predicted secreted hydrolase
LPADDTPHNDLTEWWYYTGHLGGPSGASYGFEMVVFQVERQNVPVFYAAHLALSDHRRRQFFFDQRTWSLDRPPDRFDLGTDTWQIQGGNGSDVLKGTLQDYAIDLRVTPVKPPALHGTNGVVSFGPAGDSYYYSSTRMSVQGTLTDHGTATAVSGEAWKDRQWGNFLTARGGGWDWFSLQLSDGTDLMLFVLRGASGETLPVYGTLVAPDGSEETLGPNPARVTALGSWESPASHATYPSGWTVDLSDRDVKLRAEPVIPDQELDTRESTGQFYWEGEVTILGQSRGRPVSGTGYVELTGYARP